MQIKVSCPCGSRFAFDVEPVDGQMPVAITCPSCGANATELANEEITRQLAPPAPPQPAAPEVPSLAIRGAAPPSPPAAPAQAPPEPPAPGPEPAAPTGGGLRIKSSKHHPDPAAAGSGATPAANPAPDSPSAGLGGGGGLSIKARAHAPEPEPAAGEAPAEPAPSDQPFVTGGRKPMHVSGGYIPKEGPEPQFGRGVLGALGGAIAGAMVWYGMYHFLEVNIFYLQLIPAVLSGVLARWLGRQDNTILGGLAAFFTFCAIFGTNYMIAMNRMGAGKTSMPSYEEKLAEAKEVVAMKDDGEIMQWLSKRHRREWERTKAPGERIYREEGFSRDDAKDFREEELPGYQKLVNGSPTKEEYEKMRDESREKVTWGMRIVAAFGAMLSIGIFGIGYLIFCLGVAYWTGSG